MYCLNSGHGCIIFCLCISICNFAFLSSEGNCCDDNYVQSRWTLGDFVDPTDKEINIELRNISEYKDPFSEWETVDTGYTGIPSWRRDLLREE